uniref:Uncharacterized protein n=1 Tax=Oryza glumipatula TaxID=40148 RepID=A0A0E0AVR4_9ORYZ
MQVHHLRKCWGYSLCLEGMNRRRVASVLKPLISSGVDEGADKDIHNLQKHKILFCSCKSMMKVT